MQVYLTTIKGHSVNKLITVVKCVLVAIGFLTVYALVDIFYNVNLLAPLWWLLEHKYASNILCIVIAAWIVHKIDKWITKKLSDTKIVN